jgi:hypothetical protein
VKGPSLIGIVLVALGVLLWWRTPGGVTWGNHHYLKHVLAAALCGLGVVFFMAGARRS